MLLAVAMGLTTIMATKDVAATTSPTAANAVVGYGSFSPIASLSTSATLPATDLVQLAQADACHTPQAKNLQGQIDWWITNRPNDWAAQKSWIVTRINNFKKELLALGCNPDAPTTGTGGSSVGGGNSGGGGSSACTTKQAKTIQSQIDNMIRKNSKAWANQAPWIIRRIKDFHSELADLGCHQDEPGGGTGGSGGGSGGSGDGDACQTTDAQLVQARIDHHLVRNARDWQEQRAWIVARMKGYIDDLAELGCQVDYPAVDNGGGNSTGQGGGDDGSSGGGTGGSTSNGGSSPYDAQKWKKGSGKKIFVSPGGKGNGANSSSPRSLVSALSAANAGDEIILLPGKYGESVKVTKGGTSDKPILIRAQYPAVSMNGSQVNKATSSKRATFSKPFQVNAGNVAVIGLHFSNGSLTTSKADAPSVLFKNNHLDDIQGFSINSIGKNQTVGVIDNYLTSFSGRSGYGIRIDVAKVAHVRGNVIEGEFNHQISFKRSTKEGHIVGNLFRGCGHTCIHAGQTADYDRNDATGGTLQILNNNFIHKTYGTAQHDFKIAIRAQNFKTITISKNTFSSGWRIPVHTEYLTGNEGSGGNTGNRQYGHWGVKPQTVNIHNNRFNGGTVELNGRGTNADHIDIKNNTGSASCKRYQFNPNKYNLLNQKGLVLSTFVKNVPSIKQSGNSFTCK